MPAEARVGDRARDPGQTNGRCARPQILAGVADFGRLHPSGGRAPWQCTGARPTASQILGSAGHQPEAGRNGPAHNWETRHISNNLIATILTLAGIAVWMLVQPPTVGGADGRTLLALVLGSVALADWWQIETAPADEDQDNVAARPERVLAEGVLSRFAFSPRAF